MPEYSWLAIVAATFLIINTTQFTASAVRLRAHWHENHHRLRSRQASLQRSSQVARLASQVGAGKDSQATAPQWRIMEVAEVVQESKDCRSYYLVDPYGQQLPDFRPGQYAMVRPAFAGAFQATRCYSLSSSPDPRYWRITVKLHELEDDLSRSNSRGLSAWLHRTIGKGDCLLIGGPGGQFFLPAESRRELVLIAAGVGITPMASMLRWSLEATPDRPVTLLYQAKDAEHWPLGRALHAWQPTAGNMSMHTFFSRLSPEELDAEARQFAGKVHAGKLDGKIAARLATSPDADYYMCGPDTWMEQVREQLQAAGVGASHIHWESFGSAMAPKATSDLEAGAHEVTFALSDVKATWQDPEQTLWEMARANDVVIPSGCLSGACGSCRVRLLAGQVQYDRSISIELANDECLTCIARPASDISIEA